MDTKALCDAIRDKQVLEVLVSGMTRVVEPYLLFETKDHNLVLHAWQTGGEYDRSSPPDWCDLRVDEIDSATPTGATYNGPQHGYNPRSRRFHRVICHV